MSLSDRTCRVVFSAAGPHLGEPRGAPARIQIGFSTSAGRTNCGEVRPVAWREAARGADLVHFPLPEHAVGHLCGDRDPASCTGAVNPASRDAPGRWSTRPTAGGSARRPLGMPAAARERRDDRERDDGRRPRDGGAHVRGDCSLATVTTARACSGSVSGSKPCPEVELGALLDLRSPYVRGGDIVNEWCNAGVDMSLPGNAQLEGRLAGHDEVAERRGIP